MLISPLPHGTEIDVYIGKSIEHVSKRIREEKIVFGRISQILIPGDKEYWTIIMFNNKKR